MVRHQRFEYGILVPSPLNPPNLTLQPWDSKYLYFNGSANLNNMGSPYPISSNYITIIGQFIEPDGITRKDFAQTIPFEAVLVTGATRNCYYNYTIGNHINSDCGKCVCR